MDLVTILRDLWRMRVLVGLAGVVAVLAAIAVAFQLPSMESRRQEVGIATAGVLVDTPTSQVLEVAPKGSDILGIRANLLAQLMVEGEVRAAIAKQAGLRPKQLQGIAESSVDPSAAPPPTSPTGPVLTTRVVASTDGDLPLIEVEAQNTDAASAAKLADAAVSGLRNYLDSKAAVEEVPDAKRLRVIGLGRAQAGEVVRGPGLTTAFAVALFIFALGCAAILVVSAVVRSWRAVAADETFDSDVAGELLSLDSFLGREDPAASKRKRTNRAG
jgi:hypothetical protein